MSKSIINKTNVKQDMERKGQVTIFVILALVIVGIIVVMFAFPQVNVFSTAVNPSSYLKDCIAPEVTKIKDVLSRQGGYQTPNSYTLYQDEKISYLCYTAENFLPCKVQQPLLIRHIEQEIKKYIGPRAQQCLQDLKNQYERKGYSVTTRAGVINVSIIPSKILVDFIAPMTIKKGETQTFQKFAIAVDTEWYDLILTAVSIIDYESTYGDSETGLYISYYPNLKIDKTRRDDGSTIYKLSNIVTKDTFDFATRSLVWPPGLR